MAIANGSGGTSGSGALALTAPVPASPQRHDGVAVQAALSDAKRNQSLKPHQDNTHNRSESSYSNNYSLLEMYESGMESDAEQTTVDTEGLVEIAVDQVTNKVTDLDVRSSTAHAKTIKDDVLSKELLANAKRKAFVKPIDPSSVEEILKSDYDRYGFKKVSLHQKITAAEYNKWFADYAEYSVQRKKKWDALMKSNGLNPENTPTRFPAKSDKVKKMIRKGIPGEWRGNAWFFYAGGYDKLNKHVGIYDKIVRDTKNIHNKDNEVIERDLNRTFPDNIYFNHSLLSNDDNAGDTSEGVETPMIKSLRRVLVAFAHYQPQIGYCQSLNFLAGLLLLFMTEERAFWMLVILTERIIPKVHSANLEGVHTDQGVLMLCIKEYIPALWSILGKTLEGETLSEDKILTKLPPVTLVTSSWFMSVYVGILPIESVLRIWDILWYEGSKTIFRFALTVCKLCLDSTELQAARASAGQEQEQIELFQFMQSYPKTIIDPNHLIDNCFKKIGGYGLGSLSQDEINRCRIFVAKQRSRLQSKNSLITAEMSEEEKRRLGDDIHDVYGFHRSIMNGVAWNNNISNKMKKRFSRRNK